MLSGILNWVLEAFENHRSWSFASSLAYDQDLLGIGFYW